MLTLNMLIFCYRSQAYFFLNCDKDVLAYISQLSLNCCSIVPAYFPTLPSDVAFVILLQYLSDKAWPMQESQHSICGFPVWVLLYTSTSKGEIFIQKRNFNVGHQTYTDLQSKFRIGMPMQKTQDEIIPCKQ